AGTSKVWPRCPGAPTAAASPPAASKGRSASGRRRAMRHGVPCPTRLLSRDYVYQPEAQARESSPSLALRAGEPGSERRLLDPAVDPFRGHVRRLVGEPDALPLVFDLAQVFRVVEQ